MAIGHREEGSALVEAAIIFPVLVLILYWSSALTDVLVLKLKAAEAVRYALWETTVFKTPEQIQDEVQRKFVDLRSPRDVTVQGTGLLLTPSLPEGGFKVALDTSKNVSFGSLAKALDAEMEREGFNVQGKAEARVSVGAGNASGSPILNGGELLAADLGRPSSLAKLVLQAPLPSERPMKLVFDTWKAWPRSAKSTDGMADVTVSPMRTYPVVEEQVSAQVNKMVFFGLNQNGWFDKLRSIGHVATDVLGLGSLPDIFSAARMDGPGRGPITILPPEPADQSWVPSECDVQGRSETCATQRLGDLRTAQAGPAFLDDTETLGSHVDRTRYTLPFRINTKYWTQSGGTNAGDGTGGDRKLQAPPSGLSEDNEYVKTYHCRGHFFAGAQSAQEGDPARRYARECSQ
jgi:hypothetical protein